MPKDQDFPISLEIQLLGGLGKGPRTTANLCTPGTNVVMNGQLHTPHCTNSTSQTYDGDQWVRVEVLVHGDELVRHMIDGKTVLEYSKPQIGGGAVSNFDPAVKIDGTLLTGGYISIQAETAPTISGRSSCSISKAAWIQLRRATSPISSSPTRRCAGRRGYGLRSKA